MRTPPKPKPQSIEEIQRVLRIADVLIEELRRRNLDAGSVILEVAEHIAARTEN